MSPDSDLPVPSGAIIGSTIALAGVFTAAPSERIMSNWNPTDYHQHSAQQQKWATELLAKLDLKGSERVLDIGCGDGKITAEIARAVPNGLVVGLDSSSEMIDFARKAFPDTPNLRFQQGDARSLTFDGEFDSVVSFATLHWVIDHRPVLAGIRRSLRPGGRVLMQFGGEGNAADMVQVVSEIVARPRWADCFANFQFPWGFYSPEEYRPWLEAAGFRDYRVELIPKDMTHEGREGLAGWLRTTWMPFINAVPASEQDRFLGVVLDDYLKIRPVDPNGLAHLGWCGWRLRRGRRDSCGCVAKEAGLVRFPLDCISRSCYNPA